MNKLLRQVSNFRLAPKSKFWKPKFCQAIPEYMQPKFRDPFEYPLRSKQEIDKQLALDPPNYEIWCDLFYYTDLENFKADYQGKIQLMVDMKQLKLGPKQKARLIFLLGPRYKQEDLLKITVKASTDYKQNIAKGKQMIHELYLEALRAPYE